LILLMKALKLGFQVQGFPGPFPIDMFYRWTLNTHFYFDFDNLSKFLVRWVVSLNTFIIVYVCSRVFIFYFF
jgi:hypothetical protein